MSARTVESLDSFSIIKRDTGNYVITYHVTGDAYHNNFYLNKSEIKDILTNENFAPFYVDGYDLLRFTGRSLWFANIEGKQQTFIPFRRKEFFTQLELALNAETDVVMDLMPAFLDSLKQSQPSVVEEVTEEAAEICRLEGISDFLDHVRDLAKNYSHGQDHTVYLKFMKDFVPKSLYWAISHEGNLLLNGGIIHDAEQNTWGIHT